MQYWLMKSEPDEVSIDDLAAAPERAFPWTGVRNYQARNFMRDAMQPGDPYFDAAATPEKPRWWLRDVRFVQRSRLIGLPELRSHPELAEMRVLAKGNRLSITPVSTHEWQFIVERLFGSTTYHKE